MPNPVCVCGHTHDAHEHYRRGTDCGTCGPEVCPRFRRALLRRGTPPAPPTSPGGAPRVQRIAAAPLLLTAPLAIVTDLRAHAARRLPAV
ncbi:hypothetical protein [uncultured Amnibacterium sp.]|uniref:hypothetical protein n=1 Tax=uncultured Amnibacterium sp. TaxID=1631851 RepID=UPI0035CBCA30